MMLIDKVEALKNKLALLSPTERYNFLMEMGQNLPFYAPSLKTESNRVPGCQSILYLNSELIDGKLFFLADADALISKGLAALLIHIYSGETPTAILSTPPSFLKEVGILSSLSPTRSNGLANIYSRIQKAAIAVKMIQDYGKSK